MGRVPSRCRGARSFVGGPLKRHLTTSHRRSVRLKGYDYGSPGAYFVTICTHQRQMFFDDPVIRPIAETCWRAIPEHAQVVELDEWVIMPNHLHGLLGIQDRRGVQQNAPTGDAPTGDALATNSPTRRDPDHPFSLLSPVRNTLPVIVRTYKAAVTAACREAGRSQFAWQRGSYEHVVRDERARDAVRRYIRQNPLRWSLARDNPYRAR